MSDQTVPNRIRKLITNTVGLVKTRRWVRILGIVLLTVIILAVIPGYVASQSAFLNRSASLSKYYVSWSKSTHAEVGCSSCHVAPRPLNQMLYRVKMLGQFYASLLSQSSSVKPFGKPPSVACQSCHFGGRTASPSGDLKIPHRAHVDVLKLPCVRCHKYVVHFKNPEGKNSPRMVTCLVCHDGKQATRDCKDCHKRKSYPVSHRAVDWLAVHGSKQAKIDCNECHGWVKDFCRQCHAEKPASHKGFWRTLHKVSVGKNRSCEACHKPPFCNRCHGETPVLNLKDAPGYVQ